MRKKMISRYISVRTVLILLSSIHLGCQIRLFDFRFVRKRASERTNERKGGQEAFGISICDNRRNRIWTILFITSGKAYLKLNFAWSVAQCSLRAEGCHLEYLIWAWLVRFAVWFSSASSAWHELPTSRANNEQ